MTFSIDEFSLAQSNLPVSLKPWMICQSSLTEKLKALSGEADIEVLAQHWRYTNEWEKQALHLEQQMVFHREIVMWSHDKPCWYARTIIPKATYAAGAPIFNRLATESLGALIFNEHAIKRVQLSHYPITQDSIEYDWLNPSWRTQALIFGVRLSTWMIDVNPFFLIEILLPELERYTL
jgi:chorismate--pyruvate lyase